MKAEEKALHHACRRTCSGWHQGYEEGKRELSAEVKRLKDYLKSIAGGPELPLWGRIKTDSEMATYVAQWSQSQARKALKGDPNECG